MKKGFLLSPGKGKEEKKVNEEEVETKKNETKTTETNKETSNVKFQLLYSSRYEKFD